LHGRVKCWSDIVPRFGTFFSATRVQIAVRGDRRWTGPPIFVLLGKVSALSEVMPKPKENCAESDNRRWVYSGSSRYRQDVNVSGLSLSEYSFEMPGTLSRHHGKERKFSEVPSPYHST